MLVRMGARGTSKATSIPRANQAHRSRWDGRGFTTVEEGLRLRTKTGSLRMAEPAGVSPTVKMLRAFLNSERVPITHCHSLFRRSRTQHGANIAIAYSLSSEGESSVLLHFGHGAQEGAKRNSRQCTADADALDTDFGKFS